MEPGGLDVRAQRVDHRGLGLPDRGDKSLTQRIRAVAPGVDADEAGQAQQIRDDPVAQDAVELATDRPTANQPEDGLVCHDVVVPSIDRVAAARAGIGRVRSGEAMIPGDPGARAGAGDTSLQGPRCAVTSGRNVRCVMVENHGDPTCP